MEQNTEALKRRPKDAQTRELQGYVYARLGRLEEAAEVYREWLADEPDNPKARHQLAACSGEGIPLRASDAYVQLVFDKFSKSFDAKLAKLDYRAPGLVGSAVAAELGAAGGLSVLDAGCGTGLCGPLLRPLAARLDGVDLSSGMLDKARRRNLYDDLIQAELTAYMAGHPERYDVVVSADTLVYFGDLGEAMAAAARTLRPGGLLCFTVEAVGDEGAAEGYRLYYHGRYAHHRAHIETRVREAGLDLIRLDPDWLRMEAGQRVPGWLVLANKGKHP